MSGVMLLRCMSAAPAAAPEDPNGRQIGRLASPHDVQGVLEDLHARFNVIRESGQLSFERQKGIAEQSGACIERLVDLSQGVDLTRETEKGPFTAAFLMNSDLLRRMLTYNQTRVDDMLEEKFEQMQNKDDFFASPEWQQPQYLLSVASYWLGWNNYYAALLYPAGVKERSALLEEAVSCFTRTLPDLKEPSLAHRCIFGRALCFKEQKKYEKALQDIQSLMAKVPRGDLLYMQAGYEKALISHLSGKNELAVKLIQELQAGGTPGVMPQQIKDQLRNLQTNIALDIAERKTSGGTTGDTASYQQSIKELRRIAEGDATQTGVLYRYVFDRAEQLQAMPEVELGSIGSMAVADWLFDRKEYVVAGERYQRLYAAPDRLIAAYHDGLCFRLAYCYAQQQQWQDAQGCLEALFQQYPGSSFGGKAACLYHVVAAQAYQMQPSERSFARYIKAAECYVKNCPEDQDKSEAYFQLGSYRQQQGRFEDAQTAFTRVGRDSKHYDEARQVALRICANRLQTDVEQLESLVQDGRGRSEQALKLYRESLKRAEDCRQGVNGANARDGGGEVEAYVTLLLARLYMHAAEPSPRKAMPLLKGFEGRYSLKTQQALLHDMAQKLRLECCLQLGLLEEVEREVAALIGTAAVDKTTWAFLTACAERHYSRAIEGQPKATAAESGRDAQAALVIYKSLASRAEKDSAYATLYDPIRMRLAELYTLDHQPAQAAAIYQEQLQRDPASADALYKLAVVYEMQDKWEEAVSIWSKLSRGLAPGDSHWSEARLRAAQALIRLGKHKEACEVISLTAARDEAQDEVMKRKYLELQSTYCAKQGSAGAGRE
jgi:tetratricopeptide (TPR) repeat protein